MPKNIQNVVFVAMTGLICAWSAQAHARYTIYGVTDAGIRHLEYNNKRMGVKIQHRGLTEAVALGPRWGIRGAEDIGGGNKVQFALESGFSLLTGNLVVPAPSGPRLFSFQAWLGLSNDDWGVVAFGRQYDMAVHLETGLIVLPWSDAFETANSGGTFTTLRSRILDNVLSYISPVFSGFRFGIGYSPNLGDTQTWNVSGVPDSNVKSLNTAVSYRNGPWHLGGTYDRIYNPPIIPGATGASGKSIRAWTFAGSYDFGPIKLHMGYGQDRNGVLSTRIPVIASGVSGIGDGSWLFQAEHASFQNADSYKTSNYSIGAGVPLDSDSVIAAAWQSSRLGSGAYRQHTAHTSNMTRYAVVYTRQLSPRLQLHAAAIRGNGYAFDDVTVTQFLLGLRHLF